MPSGQPAGCRRYKRSTTSCRWRRRRLNCRRQIRRSRRHRLRIRHRRCSLRDPSASHSEQKQPEQDVAQRSHKHDQDNYAKNEQLLPGQPLFGLAAGLHRELRAVSGQFNAGILRDDIRDSRRHQRHGAVVVVLPQQRDSLAAEASDLAVGQDRFQSVADFDAVFVVLHRQQDQDTVVRGFASDTPLLVQGDGVALDVRTVESVYRDYGDLRLGFLVELLADVVQLRDGGLVEDVGEVVDVVGGTQLGDRLCRRAAAGAPAGR